MSSLLAVLLVIAFGLPPGAGQSAQDARALLVERDRRNRPKSEEYLGEIIVIAKNGRERRKMWRSYRSGPAGNSDRLIRFLSPPDVRGVGYLGHFRPGKPPDEWLYLPSMKRERRIGARDREDAFAGTSFAYEDLDLLEFDDARYQAALLPAPPAAAEPVYVIELRPRTSSAYSKKVLVLQRSDLRLLSVEYFVGADAAPAKRLTMTGYTRVDGYLVATAIEMSDLKNGGRTIVRLHELALDRPQPRDRYTIQNLLREDDAVPARRGGAGEPRRDAPGTPLRQTALAAPAVPGGFSGYGEVRTFGHFGDSATRRSTTWATLFVRQSARIGAARFVGSLRLEASDSPQEGPVTFDPADRDRLRSPVSIRELSLALPVRGVDLQVGRFDVAWGETDGYSPADAFLPRDLSDPLTEERLPLWGALVRGERRGFRFDVIVAPVTTPWRLPAIVGAASPFARFGVLLDERAQPVAKSGFGAVRVTGTRHGWDLGVWARSGVRPAAVVDPHFDPSVTLPATEPIVVPVDRRFARERAAGGSIAHAIGDWMVRTEIGVFRSDDPALGTAAIWSAGASRLVRNGTFTATFAMNTVEPRINPLLLFDRALLPCVILAMHEYTGWGSWSAGWLSTFRTVGGVFSAEMARDLNDSVKVTAGTELPHGATLSPATAFSGGRRLRVALRWSW